MRVIGARSLWMVAVAGLLLFAHARRPDFGRTAQPPASDDGAQARDPVKGAERRGLDKPPVAPRHEKRRLHTAAELARDLHEVVEFLEHGQAYFRAYRKGTHSLEENERFLRFLESYEAELGLAKKEVDTLREWIYERGSLEAATEP
ncbi:MAG: hypothetical protein ABII00_02060 [Elusimicrobiota bacterium]